VDSIPQALKKNVMGKEAGSSEILIEISSYARATVHALQRRKPGSGPVNWAVLARDLNLTEKQLKSLAKVHLPDNSNWVPLSSPVDLDDD
jgi:hypothetical protein